MSVYQVIQEIERDDYNGRQYTDEVPLDEEKVYATKERAQEVADALNVALIGEQLAHHNQWVAKRQARYDKEQREHRALMAAGLRDSPLPPLEPPPRFVPQYKYRVDEIEVIE